MEPQKTHAQRTYMAFTTALQITRDYLTLVVKTATRPSEIACVVDAKIHARLRSVLQPSIGRYDSRSLAQGASKHRAMHNDPAIAREHPSELELESDTQGEALALDWGAVAESPAPVMDALDRSPDPLPDYRAPTPSPAKRARHAAKAAETDYVAPNSYSAGMFTLTMAFGWLGISIGMAQPSLGRFRISSVLVGVSFIIAGIGIIRMALAYRRSKANEARAAQVVSRQLAGQ